MVKVLTSGSVPLAVGIFLVFPLLAFVSLAFSVLYLLTLAWPLGFALAIAFALRSGRRARNGDRT